jgi:hypothetical protein
VPTARFSPLQEALRGLERRLRRKWAGDLGAAPPGLRAYRAAWLHSFRGPYRASNPCEMNRALSQGDPLLISDFHPLGRSSRMLAQLIGEIDWPGPPCLVLELLPECAPVPAQHLVNDQSLRLNDGRLAHQVYAEALQELALKKGFVAGCWLPGDPAERDLAAARQWQVRRHQYPALRQILYFGDWHLAAPHLPAALTDLGAQVQVLHQSPEPLWDRIRSHDAEAWLQLANRHWAWLHTPPLAHWSSLVQQEHEDFGRHGLETAASLVEELAETLADFLQVANPHRPACCFGLEEWPTFLALLPPEVAAGFHPDFAPGAFMVHPSESLFWMPAAPSWNNLVEMAAHSLLPENPAPRTQLDPSARVAFRRLWPKAWNPFLTQPDRKSLQAAFAHTPDSACSPSSRQNYLEIELKGVETANAMLNFPLLDPSSVRDLLFVGSQAFIWYLAISTIQASQVRA